MAEKRTNRRRLLTNSQKTESSKPLILFRLLILSQHNFLSLTAMRTTTTPLALTLAGLKVATVAEWRSRPVRS